MAGFHPVHAADLDDDDKLRFLPADFPQRVIMNRTGNSTLNDRTVCDALLRGVRILIEEGRQIYADQSEADIVALRLADAFLGLPMDAGLSTALHDLLEKRDHRFMTQTAAALVRGVGMHPGRLAAVCQAFPGVVDFGDHSIGYAHVDEVDRAGVAITSIALGPGRLFEDLTMVWRDPNHLLVPQLPRTIALSLPGLPLSDVVSHPDLDTLEIVISGVVTEGARTRIEIVQGDTLSFAAFLEDWDRQPVDALQ